jgi:hypothetical protein
MAVIATILLTIHLLAMNVASAGPLVCIWLQVRGRRGEEAAWQAGKSLSRWAVAGLFLGVVAGMAQGVMAWFDPSQGFADAVARFPRSAVANFVGEVLFAFACLGIYAGEWTRWRNRPWLHGLFAVLATTNLLYHFPPLMVVLNALAVRPEMVVEPTITRDIYRPLMLRPEILSQSLHFVVASVAAAGVALIFIARRQRTAEPEGAQGLIVAGARIALAASLVQLAGGIWLLFELSPVARGGLTGDALLATGLFIAAIVVTLGLLHLLATIALGDTCDENVRRCVLLFLGVVFLMTTMLRVVRSEESVRSHTAARVALAKTIGIGEVNGIGNRNYH